MNPNDATLESWASSLVIDYPTDDIPSVSNGDWRSFGNALAQCESFSEAGAPGTSRFKEWRPWAVAVFRTMVNFT